MGVIGDLTRAVWRVVEKPDRKGIQESFKRERLEMWRGFCFRGD